MSLNSVTSLQTATDTTSPFKTKKRKHEGKDGRDSSKKRKQDETQLQDAVRPAAEEVLQAFAEKKKRKKSKKNKGAVVEESISNGHGTPVPEDVRPAEEPTTADDPAPGPPLAIKTKKKKSKSKHTEDAAVEDHAVAAANGTSPANSDIELRDASAPPFDTDTDALPTTQNALIADLLSSSAPSPFHSTRLSLLLSIPAIAISQEHALSSILATHLSPLLLTYFPPARGIVLAFSDTILSAKLGQALNAPLRPPPPSAVNPTTAAKDTDSLQLTVLSSTGEPTTPETLALASDEFGACWAWLTVTLLVFRPERGDELTGCTNVVSEGFIGVVGYNYFQAAIGKARIPRRWKWMGATGSCQQQRKKGRKGRLGDGVHSSSQGAEDAGDANGGPVHGQRSADDAGYFIDEKGEKVPEVLKFRVVDTEMVPAHEAGGLSLQIDATLLDKDAEEALIQEEKEKFEKQRQGRLWTENGGAVMSGGLGRSRQGSVMSAAVGS